MADIPVGGGSDIGNVGPIPGAMPSPSPAAPDGAASPPPGFTASQAAGTAAGAPGASAVSGMARSLGGRISDVTRLPRIDDVPVREILTAGLGKDGSGLSVEDAFTVGTPTTTPPLSAIPVGWPKPRVFWRILGLTLATYVVLRVALENTNNMLLLPGMIVIGAFIVPLSVAVFFLEMNSPRNVSLYQLGKMTLFGGALGVLLTLLLGTVVKGSGTGQILPALLTGVVEETGKAAVLLTLIGNRRYRWQLNGLVFGAAVGAGFAGLESAGYAFMTLFNANGAGVFDSIMLRAVLAPGGHVIWTAMIGAALWEVKGDGRFEPGMLLHPTVVRRWAVAVILHGLWDANLIRLTVMGFPLQQLVLSLLGWYIIFAILKQGVHEVDGARAAAVNAAPATSG